MRRAVRFVTLFLLAGTPAFAQTIPEPPPPLPAIYAVHYALDLTLPLDGTALYGRCEITGVVRDTGEFFWVLDLAGLTVDSLYRNGTPIAATVSGRQLMVALTASERIGDTIRVRVVYEGHATAGLYANRSRPGPLIFWTQTWWDTARYVFPCQDRPDDKATFDFTIHVPDDHYAVCNGTRTDSTADPDSAFWTRYRYEMHQPMATYLASVQVYPFFRWTDSAATPARMVPCDYYVYAVDSTRARFDFGRTREMITVFDSLFGAYPYDRYGQVENPVYGGQGGMENQALSSIGDRLIDGRRSYEAALIAHELTHAWFGDNVTPCSMKDFWISEGFATYGEALLTEHVSGAAGLHAYVANIHQRYQTGALSEGIWPIWNPRTLLGATVYEKGGSIVHVLRHHLGDAQFFAWTRAWNTDYAYSSRTTGEMREHLKHFASPVLIDSIFDAWVYGAGWPHLRVEWYDSTVGTNRTCYGTITQFQEQPQTYPLDFTLRIAMTGGDSLDLPIVMRTRATSFSVPVGGPVRALTCDPEGWYVRTDEITRTPTASVPSEVLRAQRLAPLRFAPNPFAGRLTALVPPTPSSATLELFDWHGRIVHRASLPPHASEYAWTWNAPSDVAAGVYLVRMTVGDVRTTQRVTLLR